MGYSVLLMLVWESRLTIKPTNQLMMILTKKSRSNLKKLSKKKQPKRMGYSEIYLVEMMMITGLPMTSSWKSRKPSMLITSQTSSFLVSTVGMTWPSSTGVITISPEMACLLTARKTTKE